MKPSVSTDFSVKAQVRRALVFAVHSPRNEVDAATWHQLAALRQLADTVVIVVDRAFPADEQQALRAQADRLILHDGPAVGAGAYQSLFGRGQSDLAEHDEVVLTGNSWFGPIGSFDEVMHRMSGEDVEHWRLIETTDRDPEAFPQEGFPVQQFPWIWTVVRGEVLRTPAWREFWRMRRTESEDEFADFLSARGLRGGAAFAAAGAPRGNPGTFAPGALISQGCPVLLRNVFAQFPPLLERFAVLVRPILAEVERLGYPMPVLWQSVVRTTPLAALNSLASMLEVLPEGQARATDADTPLRVCVLAHVPNLEFVDELAARLKQIPGEFDLVVTTTDGTKASKLRKRLDESDFAWAHRAVVRVSWVPGGRDMGALLIGCRDILLSDDYDLIVRVHGRTPRRKSANVREYGRRYQLENLLSSPASIQRIFDLFRREPGLGLVFPPMVHIGYGTMGRGWGVYRQPAADLCEQLGIDVPLDYVSPLAPYGGMWIGRPEALRKMTSYAWNASDYRRTKRRDYVELTRVQERLLALAAAEAGYHSRTVLNREHAQIAFTALEFKADELFSTTRGYPVEQIHLLRRAGWLGYGGPLSLARMHTNLNYPRVAAVTQPAYRALRNASLRAKATVEAFRGEPKDNYEGDDE